MRSLQQSVSPEEWKTRVDLAAAYRLVAHYGWDDLVFTHISARVPQAEPSSEEHFLINPYGMMFDEITASSLVKIDMHGEPVEPTDYSVNPAGFLIHSAVHAVREDAACVMHLHSPYGIAVSAQTDGLLSLSQQSTFVLASLAYHDYEGVALNYDERGRLQSDLGDKTFMILRNHGLLTVGSSIADAFLFMYLMENACKIQCLAQAGGGPGNSNLTPVPQAIVDGIAAQAEQVTKGLGGKLAWPGLLRKLDRVLPGYDQ